jgi:methylenetetrahydrofolate--tRNA-(uracil-5-)-methyltransferase
LPVYDEEQYETFYNALVEAKSVPLKSFEETHWFESCLPIEEIARRGVDTLRFGPYEAERFAAARNRARALRRRSARQENLMADAYSLVGFQNHLRTASRNEFCADSGNGKRRVFAVRTNSPQHFYQFAEDFERNFANEKESELFFAGQITGVEGYVESVGTGWLAGLNAARILRNEEFITAPTTSAIGALCRYVSNVETKNFQPVNITFGLLEELPLEIRKKYRNKRERHGIQVELALKDWDEWLNQINKHYTVNYDFFRFVNANRRIIRRQIQLARSFSFVSVFADGADNRRICRVRRIQRFSLE